MEKSENPNAWRGALFFCTIVLLLVIGYMIVDYIATYDERSKKEFYEKMDEVNSNKNLSEKDKDLIKEELIKRYGESL